VFKNFRGKNTKMKSKEPKDNDWTTGFETNPPNKGFQNYTIATCDGGNDGGGLSSWT